MRKQFRKFFVGKSVRSANSCYSVCRHILKCKLIITHKEITLHSAVNGRGEAVLKCEKDYKFTRKLSMFDVPSGGAHIMLSSALYKYLHVNVTLYLSGYSNE
jgi:hypothetical protein